MEGYTTEDEQLDKAKQWWSKNGKSVILGLIVGLSAMLATRMWLNSQEVKRLEASALYEAVITGLEQENFEMVMDQGGAIVSNYSGTPYAALSALAMAKAKREQDDLAAAANYLNWALENAKDEAVRLVARLRLAQLTWAQGQPQQALDLLGGVDAGAFTGSYEELRGDILLDLGRADEAKQAYSIALDFPEYSGDRGVLTMKLDDLGGR